MGGGGGARCQHVDGKHPFTAWSKGLSIHGMRRGGGELLEGGGGGTL